VIESRPVYFTVDTLDVSDPRQHSIVTQSRDAYASAGIAGAYFADRMYSDTSANE